MSDLYVTNKKIGTVSTAGKLRGTLTDTGFRQVQIAYLAVISNLDKLVQLRLLGLAIKATLVTLTSD